jgi:dGTPase
LVGFRQEVAEQTQELARFLRDRVYRHHRVLRMTANGKRILTALFEEYCQAPELLPERHLRRWAEAGSRMAPTREASLPGRTPVPELPRVVGDYLAGMTDRFAQQEYRRLFHPAVDL